MFCLFYSADIIEDMYSPRTAAINFISELIRKRGKENLQKFLAFIVEVFRRYCKLALYCHPTKFTLHTLLYHVKLKAQLSWFYSLPSFPVLVSLLVVVFCLDFFENIFILFPLLFGIVDFVWGSNMVLFVLPFLGINLCTWNVLLVLLKNVVIQKGPYFGQ